MAAKQKKAQHIYWKERPPGSGTSIITEWKMRGFMAAAMLYTAKSTFKKMMIPTLKKVSKKLHRDENDSLFLKTLYSHESRRGTKPNAPLAYVYGTWLQRLEDYPTMDQYMKDWVPEDALPILKSGETSGMRGEAVDRYIWMLQQKKERRSAIVNGLFAPAINITIMIAYLIIIAKYIDPGYEKGLPRDHWKGILKVVGILSDIVNLYITPLAIFIAIAAALIVWSLPNYTGKYRVFLEKYSPIPIWKVYKQNIGANFMMSYAALNRTSMAENDIIETIKSTASKYYLSRLNPINALTEEGVEITEALDQTGLEFPDEAIITELLNYQGTDDFSKEIENIAQDWVETSIEKTKGIIKLIDILIVVACYCLLILIIMGDFEFIREVQKYMKGH